jgi:hypothetical protein
LIADIRRNPRLENQLTDYWANKKAANLILAAFKRA